MRGRSVAILAAVTAFGLAARAAEPAPDDRVARAKGVFERYVVLGKAFDPSLADLYADDARIRNRRTYPTGEVGVRSLPAPKYKELIRSAMALAKERGDTSTYSDVRYEIEGDGVRITADRFSNLKQYHSPISLLVKPNVSGDWLIVEELSESQP
jgi:hypothetical protein